MHICVSKLSIIGSDNSLSSGRCQANTWTNDGILLIWPVGTNFGDQNLFVFVHEYAFEYVIWKMASICFSINVFKRPLEIMYTDWRIVTLGGGYWTKDFPSAIPQFIVVFKTLPVVHKQLHPTLHNGCDYLFVLGLKLITWIDFNPSTNK